MTVDGIWNVHSAETHGYYMHAAYKDDAYLRPARRRMLLMTHTRGRSNDSFNYIPRSAENGRLMLRKSIQ